MRRRAFSLFELLVVVSISAVVLSLLLSVMSLVRERAQRVSCASSLRNWGITWALYAQNNRGRLPRTPGMDQPAAANWFLTAPPGWPSSPTWNFYDQFSIEMVADYMPGSTFSPGNQQWRLNDLYACPSNRAMHRSTAWNSIGSAWFPYCYFGWVKSWQPGSRTSLADQTLTDRRLAPDRLLMQDLVLDQRDHGSSPNPLPFVNHARSGKGGQTVAWTNFSGANQLWGDGHVRWATPADFAWDGVIDKTGRNQVYGWGDRYWFAAQ